MGATLSRLSEELPTMSALMAHKDTFHSAEIFYAQKVIGSHRN
jgi:hypothetical protein